MFFAFNVYAETEVVEKRYTIKLNEKNYTVSLPFEVTKNGYSLNYEKIELSIPNSDVVVGYNQTVMPLIVEPDYSFYDFANEFQRYDYSNKEYILPRAKLEFTKEQFEDDEYMKKFYPSFFQVLCLFLELFLFFLQNT